MEVTATIIAIIITIVAALLTHRKDLQEEAKNAQQETPEDPPQLIYNELNQLAWLYLLPSALDRLNKKSATIMGNFRMSATVDVVDDGLMLTAQRKTEARIDQSISWSSIIDKSLAKVSVEDQIIDLLLSHDANIAAIIDDYTSEENVWDIYPSKIELRLHPDTTEVRVTIQNQCPEPLAVFWLQFAHALLKQHKLSMSHENMLLGILQHYMDAKQLDDIAETIRLFDIEGPRLEAWLIEQSQRSKPFATIAIEWLNFDNLVGMVERKFFDEEELFHILNNRGQMETAGQWLDHCLRTKTIGPHSLQKETIKNRVEYYADNLDYAHAADIDQQYCQTILETARHQAKWLSQLTPPTLHGLTIQDLDKGCTLHPTTLNRHNVGRLFEWVLYNRHIDDEEVMGWLFDTLEKLPRHQNPANLKKVRRMTQHLFNLTTSKGVEQRCAQYVRTNMTNQFETATWHMTKAHVGSLCRGLYDTPTRDTILLNDDTITNKQIQWWCEQIFGQNTDYIASLIRIMSLPGTSTTWRETPKLTHIILEKIQKEIPPASLTSINAQTPNATLYRAFLALPVDHISPGVWHGIWKHIRGLDHSVQKEWVKHCGHLLARHIATETLTQSKQTLYADWIGQYADPRAVPTLMKYSQQTLFKHKDLFKHAIEIIKQRVNVESGGLSLAVEDPGVQGALTDVSAHGGLEISPTPLDDDTGQ